MVGSVDGELSIGGTMSEQKITTIACAVFGIIMGILLKNFWLGVCSMLILQAMFGMAWYYEYIDALKRMVEHPDLPARARDLRNAVEYRPIEIDDSTNGHAND